MLLCLQCTDKLERDRLILFLNKLILNKVSCLKQLGTAHSFYSHFCVSVSSNTSLFCCTEKCEGGDGLKWSAYPGGSAHLGPSAHQQSYCAPSGTNMAVAFEL